MEPTGKARRERMPIGTLKIRKVGRVVKLEDSRGYISVDVRRIGGLHFAEQLVARCNAGIATSSLAGAGWNC